MDLTQALVVGLIVLAVLAFVLWPVLGRKRTPGAGVPVVDDGRIEARIRDYRAALRRGTVCEHCLYANAQSARFCAECGARLPTAGPVQS